MLLKNKFHITNEEELAQTEELLAKRAALALWDSGLPEGATGRAGASAEIGSFAALAKIHRALFGELYDFAGKLRTVNMAKGNFAFAPAMYLDSTVTEIERMPQGTFDQIVEKYVEMNIAHPFREGNGRSMRIWLDQILRKELKVVVDWGKIEKDTYMKAMIISPVDDGPIKAILQAALIDRIDDRELYLRGIDQSFYYEGQAGYCSAEL